MRHRFLDRQFQIDASPHSTHLEALPDSVARPLGKGYSGIHHFCEKLLLSTLQGKETAPGVAELLAMLQADPRFDTAIADLPGRVTCLLEGLTHPMNAAALRGVLGQVSNDITVDAVDICDTPAIYAANQIDVPGVCFQIGDAADLGDVFDDATFDVLVQDGLLNCAPHAQHPAILAEAARVAKPNALLICTVTDETTMGMVPKISREDLLDLYDITWDPFAYGLNDLVASNTDWAALIDAIGGYAVPTGSSEFVAITSPFGHFEYFAPISRTLRLMQDAGFELVIQVTATQRDSNGFDCRRHRLLLRKTDA